MKPDALFEVVLSLHLVVKKQVTSVRQLLTLLAIYQQPGITSGEMKRVLHLDRRGTGALLMILARYVEKGWLMADTKTGKDGQTHRTYWLTEEGMELLESLHDEIERVKEEKGGLDE